MPSRPATPAPRAASCFATEAVPQGRPEPPPLPFQPHPSPRLRQIKGGVLRSHQPSRPQEVLMGAKRAAPTSPKSLVDRQRWWGLALYLKSASSVLALTCLACPCWATERPDDEMVSGWRHHLGRQ